LTPESYLYDPFITIKTTAMKKLTKEDISQEVFDLYDDYAHNKIERRQFIEKLSLFAVGDQNL
jgi:carboxymethylenebutenolidase